MTYNPIIRNEILNLMTMDDLEVGFKVLANESSAGQLGREMKIKIIQLSLFCAEQEYRQFVNRLGNRRPSEYAQTLGIKIVETTDSPIGFFAFFSLYQAKPPLITIAQKTIEWTLQVMNDYELKEVLGSVDLRELAIAHELFHHLETINPDIYTRKKHTEIVGFAGLKYKVRILGISEIAGRYFSKLLTGLTYSPWIFEEILKQALLRRDRDV